MLFYMFDYSIVYYVQNSALQLRFFVFSSGTRLCNHDDTAKCHSALKINWQNWQKKFESLPLIILKIFHARLKKGFQRQHYVECK